MAEAINLFSQPAGTVFNANGNSGTLNDFDCDELDFHLNITGVAGTAPTLQVLIEELGLDGVWYLVYDNTALGAVAPSGTTIGPGLATAKTFGDNLRVRWIIGGSAGPSVTASISLTGRKVARTNTP